MSWRNTAKVTPDEPPFHLQSVTRTDCPDGSEGDWYRYVIAQGSNLITGMRSGSEVEIRTALTEMVERLNERRAGKKAKTKAPAASRAPQNTSSAPTSS